MEVWAHVAIYIPFSERLRAFRALYRAGCLPNTNTTPSNAFLQFCSESDRIERERLEEEEQTLGTFPARRDDSAAIRVLTHMGFDHEQLVVALNRANGDVYGAIQYMLTV